MLRSYYPVTHRTIKVRLGYSKIRTTKREEDEAYSLLGILDVAMPLLYDEGKVKAFGRLCDEVAK